MSTSPDRREPAEPAASLRPGPLPAYQVVLHCDEAHDRMSTLRAIMELTRYRVDEVIHRIREAQRHGRACLLVTHKERAELYAEQFEERQLNVTIERA
jgi:hypothetical protein